jgi:SAM-dependent methyltransferase
MLVSAMSTCRCLLDSQDQGSGPGDWAIAIGEAFPEARVIATDITTYQSVNAPPNVEFRIEDASQEWLFEEPFDFIHMRDIHSLPDFMHAFRQARKWLKERGTFEFVAGGPVGLKKNSEGSALQKWNHYLREGMEKAGVDSSFDYKNKATIEQAGLRVYRQKHLNIPLGEWTTDAEKRRVGRMALVVTCEGIEASSLRAFTKYLEWTVEQAQELIDKVQSELMDLANEPYIEVDYIVATRLPEF